MESYPSGQSDGGGAARPRRAGVVGVALGCLLMAACSGGASSSGQSEPTTTPPPASPSASLELNSQKPSAAAGETYTGVLRSDAIEGGCVYLQTRDGQKYEVLPPEGWQLQKAPAALVDQSGQVVARPGDTITVHGQEVDMMSICQVGPIIQATDVVQGGASS
jgi:hypothetical protein